MIALPIPPLDPVTKAVFPDNIMCSIFGEHITVQILNSKVKFHDFEQKTRRNSLIEINDIIFSVILNFLIS